MKVYKISIAAAAYAQGEYKIIGMSGDFIYVYGENLSEPFIESEYPRELKEKEEKELKEKKAQKAQKVTEHFKNRGEKLFAQIPQIGKVNASYESYLESLMLLGEWTGKMLFYRLYDNSEYEITKQEELQNIRDGIARAILGARREKWLLLAKIEKAKSLQELEKIEVL